MKIRENSANIITVSRIFMIPILGYLAIDSQKWPFFMVGILVTFSDVLDGFVARKLKIESDLGRKLDSIADWAYAVVALGFFYFFSADLFQHPILLALGILGNVFPKIFGILKFRRIPAVHLYAHRLALWSFYIFLVGSFVAGFSLALLWLFAIVAVIAGTEEVVFFILMKRREDERLHSAVDLLRKNRRQKVGTPL
jgi:phosphatidylglycerophosphate synthase